MADSHKFSLGRLLTALGVASLGLSGHSPYANAFAVGVDGLRRSRPGRRVLPQAGPLQRLEGARPAAATVPVDDVDLWVQPRQPSGAERLCNAHAAHPQVALLFLTRGDMPHARTWELWLQGAAGLLPPASLPRQQPGVAAACNAQAQMSDRLAAQLLFNAYVHVPPEAPLLPPKSLFAHAQLRVRLQTAAGTHSLVRAERALLAAALRAPRNQRFVLLTHACLPLYPAPVVYRQLIGEPRSRVNACWHAGVQYERWRPSMLGEAAHSEVSPEIWRKSSQFVAVIRTHAAAVVADDEIDLVFSATCAVDRLPSSQHPGCVSAEHYIPTLLAYAGHEDETDCVGEVTRVEWTATGQPQQYVGANNTLLHRLRGPESCAAHEAIAAAAASLVTAGTRASAVIPAYDAAAWLGPECALFAHVPQAASA